MGDGRLEPDNNPVERAIRPLVLGRKNWLFAGSDTGGNRAAAVASLVATARMNGLDPEAYLRDVLERIADHPVARVADFLPWNLRRSTAPAHGQPPPAPSPDAYEHRQVAEPLLALEMEADGPNLLGLEGRLGPDEASLVPRHDRPPMRERDS